MANRVCVTYSNREKLEPYLDALRGVGLEPVPVGPGESIALGEVAGLVITGGGDIDPGRYHEPPHSETKNVNTSRDELEDRLLREALAADLPALAICRGLQMLNVVRGGTLIQHLPDTATHRAPGKPEAHEVKIEPGSRLRSILETDACMVNSRHHQGIGRLGEGLKIAATSPDKMIEAIEIPDKRFALAVQWHPEDRVTTHAPDRKLFEAFAKAVTGA
ncbi:MAG: gamma-glutamyl-gamma-aminobutyrate hydrolase family protein [Bryobacteraceae bacterium]|jgi:gamma-glutamyl-gamma-aminobutyrate hydrolase PuuD